MAWLAQKGKVGFQGNGIFMGKGLGLYTYQKSIIEYFVAMVKPDNAEHILNK